MCLHYLGKRKPEKLRFSLKRYTSLYQQTGKHDQIINWLQLNHNSLLVRNLSNSVKCYVFLHFRVSPATAETSVR